MLDEARLRPAAGGPAATTSHELAGSRTGDQGEGVPDVHERADGEPDVFDPDDPEPDVLPGRGWAAYDLSARPKPPPVPVADTPDVIVARAVGTILATWRMDRGLRQRAVAPVLGITQGQLSRLERGKAVVSIEMLARVVALTGSALTLRIGSPRRGRTVRRLVEDGRLVLEGDAEVALAHLVVEGPRARARAARAAGGRRPGPIP